MKFTVTLPVLVASTVLLSGCFDGSSSTPDTSIRVVHAVSDAPAVNVSFNGATQIRGAEFKQAAVLTPNRGNYSVDVDALLPTGSALRVIEVGSTRFDDELRYDVIATGKVGSIAPLVLTDNGERESAESARLRVAHLSPAAQEAASEVSVYVSANGVALPADPNFSFAFGESVGPLELDAGTYQIRVTPVDSRTVVYDSGPVPLTAASDLLIAAIDNTVYGDSPVSLLVVNGSETSEILDAGTAAGLRAVHSAADIGVEDSTSVDVYLDQTPGASGASAAATFSLGETVPGQASTGNYLEDSSGDLRVAVTAAGGTATAIDATIDLALGDLKTVVAAGAPDAQGQLDAFVFSDDNRRIATEARLRVIHGAVEAQLVDVFLVPAADAGANPGNATPALDDFEYGASSGYLSVPDGDYVVFITTSDGATTLLRTGTISLENGRVYTAVARLAPQDGGNTAGLTLLDDFVVPQP